MLPDGVVVETEMIGELLDSHQVIGTGQVAKDAVTGGITQGFGLLLYRLVGHERRRVTLQVSW
jgi:hypothetical protein